VRSSGEGLLKVVPVSAPLNFTWTYSPVVLEFFSYALVEISTVISNKEDI